MTELTMLWESIFFIGEPRLPSLLLFLTAILSSSTALGIFLHFAFDNFKGVSFALPSICLACFISLVSFMGFHHIPNYLETEKINSLILKDSFESKLKEEQINLLNNAIFNYLKVERRLKDNDSYSEKLINSNKIAWDYETVKDFFENVKENYSFEKEMIFNAQKENQELKEELEKLKNSCQSFCPTDK